MMHGNDVVKAFLNSFLIYETDHMLLYKVYVKQNKNNNLFIG